MSYPFVEILVALKEHLASVGAAFDPPFKVRHHRFRDTDGEENPCLALAFRGNVLRDRVGSDGDVYLEQIMELTVDLIVDVHAQPEVDPGEPVPPGYDETGFGDTTAIIAACLDSLFLGNGEIERLDGRVWEIEYAGEPDDPDAATPDSGNVASRLVLVYRVREDQPTVLLRGS